MRVLGSCRHAWRCSCSTARKFGLKAFEAYDTVVSSMCMLHGPAGIVLRADWLAPLNPCERVHDVITLWKVCSTGKRSPVGNCKRTQREPVVLWKRALARAA